MRDLRILLAPRRLVFLYIQWYCTRKNGSHIRQNSFYSLTDIQNGVGKLTDTDKVIGDAVGSIIEKVLMEIGVTTHNKIAEIVTDHNMTFSDCYQNPDVLNFALKELFGDAYLVTVAKIKNELIELQEYKTVNAFIEAISEP